jgi:hypothetical protein
MGISRYKGIMTPARFGLQAAIVVVLIALVSWPEQRGLRAGAFWSANSPFRMGGGETDQIGKGVGRFLIGYGSASAAMLGSSGAAALHRKLYDNDVEGRRRPIPGAILALGGKLNAIVGFTRTSANSPLPFARVALRNVSTGAIEARGTADEQGRFAFLDVMPNGYVVELLDGDGGVVATSEVVLISINELRETVVRAAARQGFTAFGAALAPTAQEPVAAAADQGVNRVAAPERCASPPCDSSRP